MFYKSDCDVGEVMYVFFVMRHRLGDFIGRYCELIRLSLIENTHMLYAGGGGHHH